MAVSLDTLELTPEQLEAAKEAVRRMAYSYWVDAGRPDGIDAECWTRAERDWIANHYVPHRVVDGTRPRSQCRTQPQAEMAETTIRA